MKHLTDHEIQSYLHGPTSDERVHIEDHLNVCPDCRKQLLLYKKLGDVVISASSNPIPEGFGTAVAERLRSVRRLKRITDVIVAAVAFIGFVLTGAIVFLTPPLNQIASGYLMDVWQYGRGLFSAAEGPSEAATVLAFGLILLILFAAIDRLVIERLGFTIGRGRYPDMD